MPDSNELRQQTIEARARLSRAIEGTADAWEELAGGGEWSVRATAEHALEVDVRFAQTIAGVIGVEAPSDPSISLESAQEGLLTAPKIERDVPAVLDQVRDDDLQKPSPVLGTLYGTLVLTSHHMNLHVLQIMER